MELPRTVQEIADVIGRERALFLIGQLPTYTVKDSRYPSATRTKTFLYVPKRLRPDDNLVKIIGWKDALTIVNNFGGEMLHLANCEFIYRNFLHISIRRMHCDGMKSKEIAELLDVSERTVKRHCADIPHTDPKHDNDNTPPALKKTA